MFDYDPTTMSPNPDGCEEELPFQEGDTIKVDAVKNVWSYLQICGLTFFFNKILDENFEY